MARCGLCPRNCGAEREKELGRCGSGAVVRVARAALHFGEEPCISGTRGSGAIFFCGCPLGCVYCQNHAISRGGGGAPVDASQLADMMLRLQSAGAHNINLVTPLHWTPWLLPAVEKVRPRLGIPLVINTGGYERVETLRAWQGLADIWMPDLKYHGPGPAARYSGAADYFPVAMAALMEMHRQQPRVVLGADGLMLGGLLVRHLVLPGGHRDSLAILAELAGRLPAGGFLLSLMRQFTPTPACRDYPELGRRLTTFEYDTVLAAAQAAGLRGYRQGRGSAGEGHVPDFDLTGVPPAGAAGTFPARGSSDM